MATVSFSMSPAVVRYDETAASLRTLTLSCYSDGTAVTPTSGKITIQDNYGTEKIAETTATHGTGKLTYVIPANTATETGMNWVVKWKITIASVEYEDIKLLDFSKYPLNCPLTTANIIARDPRLNGKWATGQSSFQVIIDQAWTLTLQDLKEANGFKYINSMMDSSQAREIVLQKSLELIYRSNITGPESIYKDFEAAALDKFNVLIGSTSIFFDTDDDNEPEAALRPSPYNMSTFR